uniref:Uncharacterized protein n=1 Tax=Acrobeloides nanus TaxID=290746 RepID=A0A914CSA4_9BILA
MERKHQAIESRPQNLNNEKSKKQDLMKRSFKVGDKRVFVDVKYDKETNNFYVILGEVWAKKSRNVYINISVVEILKECLNEAIPYMDEKLVARSNFEQETDMGLLVLYSKTFNNRNLEFTFEIYSGKRGIAENRFIRFYRKDRNK